MRISDEERAAAKEYITNVMGKEYYGGNIYTNKKKDVQDAHEAIRPSYVELEPDSVKESLSRDQYNLYTVSYTHLDVYKRQVFCVSQVSKNADLRIDKYMEIM